MWEGVILLIEEQYLFWGNWVAQSATHPTLGFSSGHDLPVRGFEPRVGVCADSSEPGACFRFCVSFSLSLPPLVFCLCLSKINKCKKKCF